MQAFIQEVPRNADNFLFYRSANDDKSISQAPRRKSLGRTNHFLLKNFSYSRRRAPKTPSFSSDRSAVNVRRISRRQIHHILSFDRSKNNVGTVYGGGKRPDR